MVNNKQSMQSFIYNDNGLSLNANLLKNALKKFLRRFFFRGKNPKSVKKLKMQSRLNNLAQSGVSMNN